MNLNELAKRIRMRIAELQISNKELCIRSGVTSPTLTSLLNGKPVNMASLLKVLKVLKLEIAIIEERRIL